MKIINLDKIALEDRIVLIGGREFIVPGEVPVGLMLGFVKAAQALGEQPENPLLIEDQVKMLFNLLKLKQPDLEYETFSMSISVKQLIAAINAIVWGADVELAEEIFDGKKKGEEAEPANPAEGT